MSTASNESVIYGFLRSQLGLSDVAAAGVLGNLQVESGFDPTRPNPAEGAIGIAQWELDRRTALQRYAAAHGGRETDLPMQLGYLATELRGRYSRVFTQLRTARTPAAAAAIWDVGPGGRQSGTGFENSSGDATGTRQANAQTIYRQITTGKLTPTRSPQLGDTTAPAADDPIGSIIGAAGGAYSGLSNLFDFSWVVSLVLKSTFTIGGLGLAVLGLYAAAHPTGEATPA